MRSKKIISIFLILVLVMILPSLSMASENDISEAFIKDIHDNEKEEIKLENIEGTEEPKKEFAIEERTQNLYVMRKAVARATTNILEYTAGDNVKATLENGILTLSGTGDMKDFSMGEAPWNSVKSSITSVVIKSGVTSVGKYSFLQCSNLASVILPNGITKISDYAFCYCTNLKNITIPSSVTEIGYASFGNCPLTEISLPSKLIKIGDFAFQGAQFTTITLPATLTYCSNCAFRKCDKLMEIKVNSENETYKSSNGVVLSEDGKTIYLYPEGKKDTTYTIPSSVTKIGASSFFYSKLKTISIPNTVKEMGDYAFYGSTNLTTVMIGDEIEEIAMFGFEKCSALTDVKFGKNVNYIWHRAFAYCTSLKEITIPGTVTDLRNGALAECSSLEKVTFEIPSKLQEISYQVFLNDSNLKTVILPEGLKEINAQSFYNCTSLQSLNIPSTVTFIGANALYKCPTAAYTVPQTLTKLDDNSYQIVDKVKVRGKQNYDYAYEVLNLVNTERTNAGLSKLTMDKDLLESAMQRSAELSLLFSHTRPDGTLATYINSKVYGENIAYGYSDATKVMNGWMNSSGHKANILDSSYTSIGIGCFEHNGAIYWVQLFGQNTATTINKISNFIKTADIRILTKEFGEATSGSIVIGGASKYSFKMELVGGDSKVAKGETRQLQVRVLNAGGIGKYTYLDNSGLTWNSTNPSVISVKNGKITGVNMGNAKINASTGHYTLERAYEILPEQVTNLRATSQTSSAIKYKWNAVNNITGYKIYTYNYTTAKWEYYGKTKDTSIIIKNLNPSTIYKIKVRAYKNIDGIQHFGPYSIAVKWATAPTQEKITSVASIKGSASLKWRKIENVTGYKIYMATSENGTYERIRTLEKNIILYKKTGLESGKTYYFKVRAYKTVDGTQIFGNYSPTVAITVK